MDYRSVVARAAASLGAGDLERAERLFADAVAINPRDPGCWNALALIAVERDHGSVALERAKRAHELDRKHADYLNTLGVAHMKCGDGASALDAFRRALKVKPDSAELHYNVGKALQKLGKHADAAAAYKRASGIDPGYPGVLNNHASALFEIGRYEEARTLLERALAADPSDGMALDNLSKIVFRLEGPEETERIHFSHLARHPGDDYARLSCASVLLGQGKFGAGWTEYRRASRYLDRRHADQPERLPEDLRGTRILLRSEQGLGDVLFLLRFARGLRDRGARLTLECPPKLVPLLTGHAMFEDLAREDRAAGRPGGYDVALHLGDVPALLGCDQPLAALPLESDPRRVERVRGILAETGPGPYLGLTWRGGLPKRSTPDVGREGRPVLSKEVPVADAARVLSGLPGTVVVVQRHPFPGEIDSVRQALGTPVCDLSALNEDLAEMTAALDALDEYVGVSNTNMHLRASLGRTARALVPYPAEWRWMFEGESPWFPGFAVYRQSPESDWTGALGRLRADLVGSKAGGV